MSTIYFFLLSIYKCISFSSLFLFVYTLVSHAEMSYNLQSKGGREKTGGGGGYFASFF